MSISDADYLEWKYDTRRDQKRVVLLDLNYSDEYLGPGHGRDNFSSTLNPARSLVINTYGQNYTDIQWLQAETEQPYDWELWIDGVPIFTTSTGSYDFQAIEDKLYRVAVCAKRGNAYSEPWLVEFTPRGVPDYWNGELGDWQDVGGGKGSEGTGTLRLSSSPYMTKSGIVYDDFLASDISVEQSMDDFEGVGSFKALNVTQEINWRALYWRGHTFQMRYGDEDWEIDQFRPVASAMIEDCRVLGNELFQFDLMDGGQQFKRRFARADTEEISNVSTLLSKVSTEAELPSFNYTNVPQARLDYSIWVKLTEETEIEELVRKIANSINASIRINQQGGIDIFVPDSVTKAVLTVDDIIFGKVRMVESIPAVKRVVVELGETAGSVKATTRAATGELVETKTIKTVLNNFGHANEILAEYVDYYSLTHAVWEIGVRDTGLLQVGHQVRVEHDELEGTGIVKRIKRMPLSPFSLVDVEI